MKKITMFLWTAMLLAGTAVDLKAQWGYSADSLVLINGSTFGGGYVPYIFCTDGHNGVITVYVSANANRYQITAQRVDSAGNLKWSSQGVNVFDTTGTVLSAKISEDGNGGCFIAWAYDYVINSTNYSQYYGQHLDANGNPLWQAGGQQIVFPNSQANFSATALDILYDGDGFFMGLEVGVNGGYGAVRAARVDHNGKPVWDSAGVTVSPVYDYRGPKLISDGYGGFEMMFWEDKSDTGNIYLQRLDSNGNLRWPGTGISLNTLFPITQMTYNLSHTTTADVVATWDGYLYNSGIYAQKIDTGGKFIWGQHEVKVCDTPGEQTYPDVISDNTGGAYFAWSDGRYITKPNRIYAQRLNAAGVEQWEHNGIALDTLNTYNPNPSLAPDVNNGVRVFWPSAQGNEHVLMQRLDLNGNVICNDSGVRVTPYNTVTILYGNRSVFHRSNGGDIVMGYNNFGLYAQYVPPGCSFPAAYMACDSLHVNFGFSNATGLFSFTDSSYANSGTIQNWHWNFGDLASAGSDSSSLQNPTHNFSGPGSYTVCLTATGGNNTSVCTDSICKTVVVPQPNNACDSLFISFSYVVSAGASALSFTDSSYVLSGTIQSRLWNFDDAITGTSDTTSQQNPTHIFSAPGNYTVCDYITGGAQGNSCRDSLCETVTVLPSGIMDMNAAHVSVFPNPANDLLHISGDVLFNRCQVYNMLGQQVLNQEGDIQVLHIENLPAGIYTVRLQSATDKTAVAEFCK